MHTLRVLCRFLSLAMFILAVCGKGTAQSAAQQHQQVIALSLYPPTQDVVVGATMRLAAVCQTPSHKDDCSIAFEGITTRYTSSNAFVATVSGNLVTAMNPGKATITANYSGVIGTSVVSVIHMPDGRYFVSDARVPYSTQTQPSKTATFTDDTYHLPVKRITNSATDGGKIYATQTEYPSWDPSSSDGAYLLFSGCLTQADYERGTGCNQYLLYSGTTYAYLKNLTLGTGGLSHPNGPLQGGLDSQAPEPRWNRGTGQNSHAFTYRRYMTLREYNVETGRDTLVHNFMNEFGPSGTIAHIAPANSDTSFTGYIIFCNEYCSPSLNTRYYGFLLAYARETSIYYYVLVYDRALDRVVSYHDISGANSKHGLKGLLFSPSGQYLAVNYFCGGDFSTTEFCGVTVYNRDFTQYYRISSYPDHTGWAYDAQGHEVITISPSATDTMSFIRADTGQVYESYRQDVTSYPFILWTFQANPGWVFAGTMSTSLWGGYPFTYPSTWAAEGQYGPGQLFALELDETRCLRWFDTFAATPLNPHPISTAYGAHNPHTCSGSSPRIWRQAFNQNQMGSPKIHYYFQQVNPQAKTDGTKLWFTSNWRDASNPSEVYEVDLPATWTKVLSRGQNGSLIGTDCSDDGPAPCSIAIQARTH